MIALVRTPPFDWEALAPLVALGGGMVVALVLGLLPGRSGRFLSIAAGVIATIIAIVASVLLWNHGVQREAIARSVVIDRASLAAFIISAGAAFAGLMLVARAHGTEDAGHGETAALILGSAFGMGILAASNDLVTIFLGLEMLSIPLYVLCASHVDRTASLEAGLKYLVLGSVGSATALMGIALIYGATGSMSLPEIAQSSGNSDLHGLVYPGVALLIAGFGFKLSLAPLHQWTPDVYEGAPTPVTAWMAVATKAAAFGAALRIFDVALIDAHRDWAPALATLATITIIVGNVGALGQPGMKRLMGYSSIAQAGYLVAALSVGAMGALLAYLAAYAVSTLTVFAVIAAREAERPDLGDDVSALDGLAKERPLLAWLGTLGLFGLSGLPLTAGFFTKIAVVGALVNGDKAWLAVLVLIGSIISLAYYAPPVIRMWRSPDAEAAAGAEDVAATAAGGGAVGALGLGAPAMAGAGVGTGAAALAFAGGSGSASPTGGPLRASAEPFPDDAPAAGPFGAAHHAHGAGRPAYAASHPHAPEPVGLRWEVALVGIIAGALVLAGGLYPEPLMNLATEASSALLGLH